MFSMYTLLALPIVAAVVGSLVVSLVVSLHDKLRRTTSLPSLPSLHYRESSLNSRLLARCGLRQRVFSPPFWLTSSHVQTVLAACWPRGGDGENEVTFQREYLQMRDKGVVALDWVQSLQPRVKKKSTVLLVLPAFTGSAQSVAALCSMATKRGFRAVVFNRRGHGRSVLTTPRLLNAADPSDLRQVIKYLRLRFPKSRLAAVSYGTGCGLLISYLGEFGSSALLSAGACVSPCYDTVEKFSGPLKSVYDLVHLLKLKWLLLQHAKALNAVLNVKQALLKAWSFGSFEETVYCKMYNYVSRSDSTSQTSPPVVNVNGMSNTNSSISAVANGGSTSVSKITSNGYGQTCNGNLHGNDSAPTMSQSTNGQVIGMIPESKTTSSLSARSSFSSTTSSKPAPNGGPQTRSFSEDNISSDLDQPPRSGSGSKLTSSKTNPVTQIPFQSQTRSQSTSASMSTKARVLASQSLQSSQSKSVSLLTNNDTSHETQPSSLQPQSSSHTSPNSDSSSSHLHSPPQPCSPPSPPQPHTPPSPPPSSPGSGGVEEYWERCNPIRDVDDIAVPVLCINSLDDPFLLPGPAAIPYDLFRCYPNFLLVVTEKGGHCGFLERYPFTSWADGLCLDYLEAVFEVTTRGYVTSAPSTSVSSSASSSSTSRRNTRSTI